MPANKRLLVLPGDGIGPEVMREVRRVIDWMDKRRMVTFDVSEDVVGGASIDAKGTPILPHRMLDLMREPKFRPDEPYRIVRSVEDGTVTINPRELFL